MPIYIKDMARARQAAKSLKRNLDDWGIKKPLTWHQDTIAKMLEHADWKALSASVNEGVTPSPMDEEVEHGELMRRRAYQSQVLVERVGKEALRRCGDPEVFAVIARHVAPSGRPNAGTAYKTMEVTIDENGISLPLSLELWTEDAIFFWKDLPVVKDFEHVTRTFDPEAEVFYELLDGTFNSATAQRLERFIESRPDDNLDKLALLARTARVIGRLVEAEKIIVDAYNIGSYAWSSAARERRRLHDPVRWWEEPNTRPFMPVLYEKALIDVERGTEDSLNSGFRMFKAILALNPADPLKVRETATSLFGIEAG